MVLARIRQAAAFSLLAFAAVLFYSYYFTTAVHAGRQYWQDPAVLLYPLALFGLGLRWFWARYLAICGATAILVVQLLAWGPHLADRWYQPAGMLLFILLLSGGSMRRLFDERPGRLNRWAGVQQQVHRLRLLILSQSVALGICWWLHFELGGLTVGVVALAAAGLLGMVFQKVWALVLLGLATLAEGVMVVRLGLELADTPADYRTTAALPTLAVLAVIVVLSLALTAPFWRRFYRRLRAAG